MDCYAKVYIGYELEENWKDIIPEEYVDENIEYFKILNKYDGEIYLFAATCDSIECGDFKELKLDVTHKDRKIVNDFYNKFPEATVVKKPTIYLAGVIG